MPWNARTAPIAGVVGGEHERHRCLAGEPGDIGQERTVVTAHGHHRVDWVEGRHVPRAVVIARIGGERGWQELGYALCPRRGDRRWVPTGFRVDLSGEQRCRDSRAQGAGLIEDRDQGGDRHSRCGEDGSGRWRCWHRWPQ